MTAHIRRCWSPVPPHIRTREDESSVVTETASVWRRTA